MKKIYGDKIQAKNKKTIKKLVGDYEEESKPIVKGLVKRWGK